MPKITFYPVGNADTFVIDLATGEKVIFDYADRRDATGSEVEARVMPRVKLINRDGNAFAILAACKKAAMKAGWSEEQWAAFHTEATSGDYNHLLATVMKHFDVA